MTPSHTQILRATYILAALLAIFAALPLGLMPLNAVADTYGKNYRIFETFGFCMTLVLGGVIASEYHRIRDRSFDNFLPLAIFAAIAFHYLVIFNEYAFVKAYDYKGYEYGATALLNGNNPYEPRYYVYPPLTAQLFALTNRLVAAGARLVGKELTPDSVWTLVFYFYQCLQYLAILLAYQLSKKFAFKIAGATRLALLAATLLFVCNNPLSRTFRHGQVNLWLLDLTLAAILLLDEAPELAGIAIALAAHIKLYPIIMIVPWVVMRRWRAVAATGFGLIAIFLIQTKFATDTELWSAYVTAFFKSGHGSGAFRDNSIASVAANGLRALHHFTGIGSESWASPITKCATLVVFAFFAWRFFLRENVFRLSETSPKSSLLRSYGHQTDTLAVMLLVSPLVWEHHFVLAIPLALWAILSSQNTLPAAAWSAVLFFPPTFDVFPFSFHRVLALIALVWLTQPQSATTNNPATNA